MLRIVESEILDNLAVSDPLAIGSRSDLRRLNWIMGHADILSRAFRRHLDGILEPSQPLQLVELGAGDGTLLLRLARRWSPLGMTARVTLVDRQNLVSAETRHAFTALGWSMESVNMDVFDWLETPSPGVDVMLANLFLHHFRNPQLAALLRLAAAKTRRFIVCEPRRSAFALAATRFLGLLGCNRVTRHDAYVSVRAGFVPNELSALWPTDNNWRLIEHPVRLFSHCFVAKRYV